MEILPVYYDTECHYNAETGCIYDFVGVKCNGIHKNYKLQNFEDVLRKIAKKYTDRMILAICYNYEFDGKLLDYCADIKDEYTEYKSKEFTDKLINEKPKKGEKRVYPKFDKRFKDLKNVFFYDEWSETKGSEASESYGSLEYHASREHFKWKADINSDIYQYNRDDIDALEAIFLSQGGLENAETLLYIVHNIIKPTTTNPLNILSLKLFVHLFAKRYKITVSETLPVTLEALNEFKTNFKLPFNGMYSTKSFLFEKIDSDGNISKSNFLCKHKFILNKGGLHFGLKNTHWVSGEDRLLFNLDFASLYPMIMCSSCCPVLTPHGREQFLNFIKERMEAKKLGVRGSNDRALSNLYYRSAGLKKLLNSLYGATKKSNEYAIQYVTFIAQVSIAWFCTNFDDEDTTVIDVNTDGILISTKKTRCQVYDIVNIFNVKNEITLHASEIEVQELTEIFYKDYNNYLYMVSGKVVKIKGSFLTSRKIQKKINAETGERVTAYVICNYDAIIKTWLEDNRTINAVVLGNIKGQKKQFFDGLPLTVSEIPTPSMSSQTIVDESGYSSPVDISNACIKGFYSHFSKSNDLKIKLSKSEVYTEVYDEIDIDEVKSRREQSKIFIPFTNFTELTKPYRSGNLCTYEDALCSDANNIMLGLSTVLIPHDRNPVCILDFDFKGNFVGEELVNVRNKTWGFLEWLGDLILYAELKTGNCLDANGIRRVGIHAFVTFDTYKSIFTKKIGAEYKVYLDTAFLRVTSKKDITLYMSGKPEFNKNILQLGDITNVINLIKGGIQNKAQINKEYKKSQVCVALKVMADLKKINKTYEEWLVLITCLIDDLMAHGIGDVEELVLEFTNRVSPKIYMEEHHQLNTITTIRSLVNSHLLRKEENRLYSIDNLEKINKSSKTTEKLTDKVENINEIYNEPSKTNSTFESFFESKDIMNVLKSVTGSGKTTNVIQVLVNKMLNDQPFVFSSNSKINADFVNKSVLYILADKHSDRCRSLLDNSYLLSSSTSKFFTPTKFIFTTHHYFLPTPDCGLFKPFHSMLSDTSYKYDFYIDELDAFLSDMEFVMNSGSRYTDGVGSGFSSVKNKIEYCPVKNPDQTILRGGKQDGKSICQGCKYFPSNEPRVEKNYFVGYSAIEELRMGDETQKKEYYDFSKNLKMDVSSLKREVSNDDLFHSDVVFELGLKPTKDAMLYNKIWKNSEFQKVFVYYPTINGNIETDMENTNCESYPHYICGVAHWSGVNAFVLKVMKRYCSKKGTYIYGMSATINKNHMYLLKKVFGEETKLQVNKTCIIKSKEIIIYHTTTRIEVSDELINLPFNKKVICFFSKRKEAESKYREMKSINDKICYFNIDGFNTNSNNINLDCVKFVMSYSKGGLGRGISLESNVCIVDCSIYKPNHSYVLYTKEKKELRNQKLVHMISYILQNLGRVVRDINTKHIVLAKCPKELAEFIKFELKAKSKKDIKIVGVSDLSFINIMKEISKIGD